MASHRFCIPISITFIAQDRVRRRCPAAETHRTGKGFRQAASSFCDHSYVRHPHDQNDLLSAADNSDAVAGDAFRFNRGISMFLLRVSTALTVSIALAACSTTGTRPETAQSPAPVLKPVTAQVEPAVAIPQPVVPETAPVVKPAPVVSPLPADSPQTQVGEAQKSKPSPAARVKASTPVQTQAAPTVAAAPKTTAMTSTSLRGQVVLDASSGQNVAPGEISDAVLYFMPDGGSRHVKPGNFLIYTHNKQFDPQLLVVPVGSTVKFPNQDEILHNVYSTTPGSTFDLGIYGNGGVGEYTFRKPGLVLIHCNVHEGMQSDVLVLDTPYIARPAVDGTFDLAGLPAGPGRLMLWHPRAARPVPVAISMPTAQRPVMHIAITRPRAPSHHDKDGKAYRAAQP